MYDVYETALAEMKRVNCSETVAIGRTLSEILLKSEKKILKDFGEQVYVDYLCYKNEIKNDFGENFIVQNKGFENRVLALKLIEEHFSVSKLKDYMNLKKLGL